MSDAIVIETARHTAGIAVRERGGFRFYCADALFQSLDNRAFRHLGEIEEAVRRLTDPPASSASAGRG